MTIEKRIETAAITVGVSAFLGLSCFMGCSPLINSGKEITRNMRQERIALEQKANSDKSITETSRMQRRNENYTEPRTFTNQDGSKDIIYPLTDLLRNTGYNANWSCFYIDSQTKVVQELTVYGAKVIRDLNSNQNPYLELNNCRDYAFGEYPYTAIIHLKKSDKIQGGVHMTGVTVNRMQKMPIETIDL